ncbi:hypothetical protein PIB30_017269 [Stylosanthes scabra]|uniref:Uncharacterized protein n=1 Tax=Stylosanthes scabra TaxID=79078 RepID=A0ABU6Q7I4_9FABA|nr:hypothetical protein [Stylosanthes scabra]
MEMEEVPVAAATPICHHHRPKKPSPETTIVAKPSLSFTITVAGISGHCSITFPSLSLKHLYRYFLEESSYGNSDIRFNSTN